MPTHTLIQQGCCCYLEAAAQRWTTIFADPPDNIGLHYGTYCDKVPETQYVKTLRRWIENFIAHADTVWLSYNARWTFDVGHIVKHILGLRCGQMEAKQCVQTFTFGQHNHFDLAACHRPLLRLRWQDATLLPDAIRVQSWRQANGDKRADPRGRVPGDVFDFPRVVGNSKQRRPWHPTQLHEGLVERCIRLTTPAGGTVLDPFAGTGTTLRVCRRTGHACTLIEMDRTYCENIAAEHGMQRQALPENVWTLHEGETND